MLHPEALLIVDVLLSLLYLHSDVNMRVNELFRLCYIHLFDVSHIVGHLFNRHLGLFLINQVLNLLELARCDASQGRQADVTNFAEDEILFIGKAHGYFFVRITFLRGNLCRVDNPVRNFSVTSMYAESLIKLSFIVLLHTEGRDEVNGSVKQNQAVDFSVCISTRGRVLYQLASLSLFL